MIRRSLAALALVTAIGSGARAETHFGDKGVTLVSGSVGLQVASSSGTNSNSLTTFALTPTLAHFIAPNVLLGVQLQLQIISSGGESLIGFAGLPLIGFNVELTPLVSFVPQFLLGPQIQTVTGTGGVTLTRFSIGGFLPVVVHPEGHVFFAIGPNLLVDAAAGSSGNGNAARLTLAGVQSAIGAYF